MSKKWYYLKLKENFFDTDELKIIESQENGYVYSNLYLKLCLKSLKNDGKLMFRDGIPYDEKMIAVITGIDIDHVRSGLKILESMSMVARIESGELHMMDIQKLIGSDSNEAERLREYRERIKQSDDTADNVQLCTSVQQSQLKKSTNKRRDKSIEYRDKSTEKENREQSIITKIVESYNDMADVVGLSRVKELTDVRKSHIKRRISEGKNSIEWWNNYFSIIATSDFLCGKVKPSDGRKPFKVTFDWVLSPNNMAKIIEGNYDNTKDNATGYAEDLAALRSEMANFAEIIEMSKG